MVTTAQQLVLPGSGQDAPKQNPAFSGNKVEAIHRWVPWIAGFSATFTQQTLDEFLNGRLSSRRTVLDPFAGVGTTLVEALRAGHNAVGFEINPYAALAARVKVSCAAIDTNKLRLRIRQFRRHAERRLERGAVPRRDSPLDFRTRVPFYSPNVLTKVLHCVDFIEGVEEPELADIFKLAFGSVMVSFSNYSYEPSLTTRQSVDRQPVLDADVPLIIEQKLSQMVEDISLFQSELTQRARSLRRDVYNESFFEASSYLDSGTVDLIITSPPYVNNYHYVRNTRPQIYWLGLNKPN
ncbi:MAG: DNA methyltransferase, partial [Terriglobia bacterium]